MKYIMLLISLTVSACGITGPKTTTMNTTDLNYYRTDCAHQTEQLAFLQSQRDNAPFWDKKKKAEANYYIRFMQATCGEPVPGPQGCVVVEENFATGHSQAMVCRDSHFKGPVINRWESEIDN